MGCCGPRFVHPVRGGPTISPAKVGSRIVSCPITSGCPGEQHGFPFVGRWGQLPILMIHRWLCTVHTVLYLALFLLIIYSKALSKLLPKTIILLHVSYTFTIIYLAVFYLCYIPYIAKTNAAINSLYMYHFIHV